MPHQCTGCGHVFADGSKEMLSGCPECGGTKFQFHPDGSDIPEEPPGDVEPPDRPDAEEGVAGTVGNAAATVRNLVGGGESSSTGSEGVDSGGRDAGPTDTGPLPSHDGSTSPPSEADSPSETDGNVAGVTLNERPDPDESDVPVGEDAAQASARSDVVSPDELPDTESTPPPVEDGTVVEEPDDDRPDLSELREELNDQFESIKVLEPGQYELNLMELYDREEYIIALQEDGKYSIQVPDRWQD
jgi:predicted  nucleic acid-binding Zn-ribbon protein